MGVGYGPRALDLSRFVADPADEAIAAVVRAASILSTDEREALRNRLDADDCYNLMTFAQRRSASGMRNGSLEEALDAIQAMTLVTGSGVDPRDLSVDFPLYAVGRLGGNLSDTVASAAATSEPGTRASFVAKASRAARLTLKDCAFLEVTSRYGLGFMHTRAEPYAPQSDLAGMAIRMADRIDAAGRYAVADLNLSSLPEVWFGRAAKPTGRIPATGCVSFFARITGRSRWGAGLLVFLAEVDSPHQASSLVARAVAASTPDRPRVAASDDRLLLILIGGPSLIGQKMLETEESLGFTRDALLRELHL